MFQPFIEVGVVVTLFIAILGCYVYVNRETSNVRDKLAAHETLVTNGLRDLAAQIKDLELGTRTRQEADGAVLAAFRLEVVQRLTRIETQTGGQIKGG